MPNAMLHFPRFALCLLLLVATAPLALLGKININNAPETYLPEQLEAVQFDRALRQRFPSEEVLIALFQGDAIFSDAFLLGVHRASTRVENHPMVERVLSVTTMETIISTDDGFAVKALVDGTNPASETSDYWRARAMMDRAAAGFLVARDGSAHALVVRPRGTVDSLHRLEVQQAVQAAIEEAGLGASLTAVAGPIPLDVAQLRAMLRDNAVFVPGVLLLGLALLWLLFRRWQVLVLAAMTIVPATLTSMAVIILLGQAFNLISTITAPLISAISVAALMHLFNGLHQADRKGYSGRARVEHALRMVHKPILFTSLTTAAGLLSLSLSPIQPIATLGLAAAAGVVMIYLMVIWLLPAIILRWDHGSRRQPTGYLRYLDHVTRALSRFALRRPGVVIGVTALALVLGIPQIRHITVETDLYQFFDSQHALTQATSRVESALGGVMALEVVFDSENRAGFQDPEQLRVIQRFQQWLSRQPEVDHTYSLVNVVEDMHQAFHEADPAYRVLPDSQPVIAQYLLIHDGRDLHDIVDREFQRTRLTMSVNTHGAREVASLINRTTEAFADSDLSGISWNFAGAGRLFAEQERLLVEGQIKSLGAITLLIFGFMYLLWRSLPAAALCMLPNAAPILFVFISMGLFGYWLDAGTAMIASVAVGIAVDDTIHLYYAYRVRRRRGAGTVFAIARAMRETGRALCATTMILCLQFLLLATSDFQPTQAFGLLTAGALAAALLFDLLLLPAVLSLASRPNKMQPKTLTREITS